MVKYLYVLALVMSVLLVPVAISAQTTDVPTGSEDDARIEIEPKDDTMGPVGVTDETLKVRNDVLLFRDGHDELIDNKTKVGFWDDHYVNGISSVWPDTGQVEILFDNVHEDEIDDIRATLEMLYPGSDLIVDIGRVVLDVSSEDLAADAADVKLDASVTKTFTHSKTVNHPLIDNSDMLEVIDTAKVSDHLKITSLDLRIVITHEDHDELHGSLEDPQGNLHQIFARPRGIDDGSHTWTVNLSDQHFRNLRNADAFGSWKLRIGDYYGPTARGTDTGSVISWSLTIAGTTSVSTTSHGSSSDGLTNPNLLDLILDFFDTFPSGTDTRCSYITDDCLPVVAGMPMTVVLDGTAYGGSVGLGGVETRDGKFGFVGSFHVVTDVLNSPVFRDVDRQFNADHVLGSVDIISTDDTKTTDTVFIEYPVGCSNVYIKYKLCTTFLEHVPMVKSMEIYKRNGVTYDVTGEATLTDNKQLTWVGQASGQHTGTYRPISMDITVEGIDMKGYYLNTSQESQSGDSGGPVFDINRNGDAEIAGFIIGHDARSYIHRNYISLWGDVKSDLGLKPIT